MSSTASLLSARLSRHAEAVCRHYLSNGRKAGRYWMIGDQFNTPGSSMHVRLVGPESGPRAAGKWTDQASSDHGDLLDIIRATCGFTSLAETLAEARGFLSDPPPPSRDEHPYLPGARTDSARRLFHMARPILGTMAETYLRQRAIPGPLDFSALRYHPSCFHRPHPDVQQSWPALLAAVTDLSGCITGVHRTFLARDGLSKAPMEEPRRAMGLHQGNAVRFGLARDVLVAGEGIETILAVKGLLPHLPAAAALSANHLALLILPASLRRLYIASDTGSAGERAARRLAATASAAAIQPRLLIPACDDWNTDLMRDGFETTLQRLRRQLIDIDA